MVVGASVVMSISGSATVAARAALAERTPKVAAIDRQDFDRQDFDRPLRFMRLSEHFSSARRVEPRGLAQPQHDRFLPCAIVKLPVMAQKRQGKPDNR
jgi:hypothetical protein